MASIENKWALVTGSSRGIGQQIVWGLAKQKCNVIIHGRDIQHTDKTLQKVKEWGVKTHVVSGELGTPEGIQSVIQGVKNGPGHVDILYNNAAIQNPWKSIWDITLDEWLDTFKVNLFAMITLCNAFGPEMKRREYGRIINLTSGIKDTPNLAPYSVSKAAVDKYTRDLAAELKGTNVLVNMLDPGWLKTDMGGPNAMFPPESVVPGALVPALLEDNGPSGKFYAAQDYKELP